MTSKKKMTTAASAPLADIKNTMTAAGRGPALLQDVWSLEKLAHFDREVIPERRMHARAPALSAPSPLRLTSPRYTRAKPFAEVVKQTEMLAR